MPKTETGWKLVDDHKKETDRYIIDLKKIEKETEKKEKGKEKSTDD